MTQRTPEEIAAAQAAVNRKPADATLAEAPFPVTCGAGHPIAQGETAWRYLGAPRYDGPPMATSVMAQSVRWTCRACGRRKGWEQQP